MSKYNNNNYTLLINKLDRFIRKYYFSQLIRGVLFSIGIIIVAFLLFSLLEYYFYFSTTVRKTMYYGFLGLLGLVSLIGIVIPLLNIFKLGNVISHEQAAKIIGDHFVDVKDKLLNILNLKQQAHSVSDASLIEASISQKITEIKPIPFTGAVNLGKNKKYIKYAIIPLLCFLVIFLGAPNLIKEGTDRIINNDKEYEREAPFHFAVTNDTLEVIQFEDFEVNVEVDGNVLPNEAFIHYNNFPFNLKKEDPETFSYRFNKVQKDVSFYLEANGVQSQNYVVSIIPKPVMVSFDAYLDYPNYLGRKDEVLRNSGDMVIPLGTKIKWRFEAESTDDISIKFGSNRPRSAERKADGTFQYNGSFKKDIDYSIYLSNDRLTNADSISYGISVIPDQFPTISARQLKDSLDEKVLYFLGDAADDYGIKKLDFVYTIQRTAPIVELADSVAKALEKTPIKSRIPMERGPNSKATRFAYTWDINLMNLLQGDKLVYHFEVWDNDGVNGSKKAKTQTMSYEVPTINSLDEQIEEQNEEFKDDLTESMEEAKELKQEAKELQQEILQKKDLNWEDKAKIEDMIKKNKDLQDKMQQMKDNYDENLEKQEEFKEFSEEVKEKHEKLQEMMEKVMDEELQELLEKLEKLLDELQKDQALEELEDMEMNNEEMEMELDRLMELFKQLEIDQKMEETIEKLEELAEKQEKLSENTEQKQDGSNLEKEKQQQEKLNEEFEEIKKDIEELDKMNKELDNEKDIKKDTQKKQDDISKEQQESSQQMEKKQSKSASKKQKSAAQQMQQLAQQMQQMQQQQDMEQVEEDMKAIRQLLENLVELSFDQEDLMEIIGKTDINTPQYIDLIQNQHKLKDDAELIEDSLVALSKRVFQLEAFIMGEISEVNRNLASSIEQLAERKIPNANTSQQFTMTHVNNLALMLNEVMQQMQQQMAQQMEGDQMCNKPGSGACNKPGGKGKGKSGKMQQQLNDQIKQLQQGLKGGMPRQQANKEAAKLAAKQAMLRQAMEKLNQQRNKDGKKPLGDLEKLAEDMEQTEIDLINKNITAETLERQKKILTRLLQAEDADQERDIDKKRKADKPRKIIRKPPPEMEEFRKKKESETELYRTVPPSLRPFYKKLVEKYFKSLSY